MVSAAAHRHQDSLELSFKQVGLRFVHPLSLDQHCLTLGCADSTWILRHPAFPLVHQLLSVRALDTFYHDLYDILWCIFISAMQIVWWDEAPEIYKTSTTSSLHWCGAWLDIWGESSSSSWEKETQCFFPSKHSNRFHQMLIGFNLSLKDWNDWTFIQS